MWTTQCVRGRSDSSGARIGTEGNLGGQAVVRGVGALWTDLTESELQPQPDGQVSNHCPNPYAVAKATCSTKITAMASGKFGVEEHHQHSWWNN